MHCLYNDAETTGRLSAGRPTTSILRGSKIHSCVTGVWILSIKKKENLIGYDPDKTLSLSLFLSSLDLYPLLIRSVHFVLVSLFFSLISLLSSALISLLSSALISLLYQCFLIFPLLLLVFLLLLLHYCVWSIKWFHFLTIECPGGCPTGRILPVGQLDRAQRWRLKCSNLGPGPYVMLIKWYGVIKLRRCIAKPKISMIVCARTVTEEGMELSAVVIMCLNSAQKAAQVLPSCCLVLHLQCVLFLDVLLPGSTAFRR